MPTWTRGVLPRRRKEWRKAGRWNPVTAGARDGGSPGAPAPVAASSWTSARPTGARGGALIGQGRASAPAPTRDEEEALELEEEQEHDASPDAELRPGAYAYAQSESTGYDEPPLSQKDESPDKGTDKGKEREKESSEQEQELPPRHPNAYAYVGTPSNGYDEPPVTKSKDKDKEKERAKESSEQEEEEEEQLPPRHPNTYAYVGTPSTAYDDAPQGTSTPTSAADPYTDELPLVAEDPKAARLSSTTRNLERQVSGEDPLAGEDPSTWAPLKESKPHRNRLVARLASMHQDEKGTQRGDLIDVARDSAKTLRKHWKRIEELRDEVPPDDAEKVADFIDWLPEPLDSVLDGKSHAELLEYFTRQHANLYVRLRRQNIPVSPEGDLDEESPALKDRKVGYDDTEEAQAATLVHVDAAGKLRRNTEGNPPVDTSKSATHFSGAGVEIFVVGVDGDIHLHNHAIGQYHHSSLLDGGDVAMAGEMKVDKGKIVWLSDKSGHYVPSLDHLLQFLHRLKKDGVELDFELRGYTIPKGRTWTAAELLDGNEGTGEDAWTKVKTKLVLEGFTASKDEAAVLEAIAAAGWKREADGSVVDAGGTPVPDRDLRRHLKRHFGYRSPSKVVRGESVRPGQDAKPPEDLGFRPTVRSSAELRPKAAPTAPPAPAGPAATPAPLQQQATTQTSDSSSESESLEDEDDGTPATVGGYLKQDADDDYAGNYAGEESAAPVSTAHTKLLTTYEEAYGREAVAELLRREHLYLDEGTGHVRDLMDHSVSYEQLVRLLSQNLGPLPGQDRVSAGNYAVVAATAYSEVKHQ
ncbi:MAG: hypothetical protein ACTHOD_13290 [Motilibacteraceae bacterium]